MIQLRVLFRGRSPRAGRGWSGGPRSSEEKTTSFNASFVTASSWSHRASGERLNPVSGRAVEDHLRTGVGPRRHCFRPGR
jgi:hypothetical protein